MLLGLLRVLTGFAVACVVAALVQLTFALAPAAFRPGAAETAELVAMTATHFALFASPFALVVAALGEWQSLRGWVYYAVAGIGIAMAGFFAQYSSEGGGPTILNEYAIKAFLTPGFIAGFVYWMIAGRKAGDEPNSGPPRIAANGA